VFTFDRLLRYWLPGFLLLVCIGLLLVRSDDAALEAVGLLFGGGAAVVVVNYIQRVGFAGDVDRDKERETREFYSRYGMWPGQASPELIEQARAEGMLEHVTIPPRPARERRP
jgi:hypothetical protein